MPTNNPAKYAFFYMLSLVALTFMSVSTGIIIFQIINKFIPDVLNAYSGRYDSNLMKFAISAVVISTPVFFLTMKQIYKSLYTGELDKESGIRKWLTYFILFVSSVVMLVWLITVLNNFLDGELTMKFILKAVTAIGIAAAVFSFYYYDIKRERTAGEKDKVLKMSAYGSLILIIAVFTASLFVVESPSQTRARKIDNNILEEFNKIDGAIRNYYQRKEKLPENIEELRAEVDYLLEKDIRHPISEEVYGYNLKSEKEYELCAEFKTSNLDDSDSYGFYKLQWPHKSGYQCISKVVEKDRGTPIPIPAR